MTQEQLDELGTIRVEIHKVIKLYQAMHQGKGQGGSFAEANKDSLLKANKTCMVTAG